MKIYTPENSPRDQEIEQGKVKIFLGGSIEMGKAEDWQSRVIASLSKSELADNCVLFNPRRENWDNSVVDNPLEGVFHEQVTWELSHQKTADILIYYFAGNTLSPITLLELGLFHTKQPIIFVDRDYQRYGNVVITCDEFGLDCHEDFREFLQAIKQRVLQTIKSSPE